METKICSKCNNEKPLTEFSFRNKDKGFRRSDCKSCAKDIIDKHYQDNKINYLSSTSKNRRKKRELLREFLLEQSCADCGNSDSRVLEFDHIRGTKFSDVSRMISRNFSWKNILLEISKCEIVCANCHRIRTANTQGWIK